MNIKTLASDIYGLFTKSRTPAPENLELMTSTIANAVTRQFERLTPDHDKYPPRLVASNLGQPCERKLWYSINTPKEAEPIGPKARLKFMMGDLWEAFLLFLAAEAGHKVEGVQNKFEVEGVPVRRDAVIDGVLVDVKSASARGYLKFKKHTLKDDDPFGYIMQLNATAEACKDDPLITDKRRIAFLAGNREMGDICLDIYHKQDMDFSALVEEKRTMLGEAEPPPRAYEAVPEGKSGNMRLGTACSYCAFKKKCWPGLRTFLYSKGPMFLVDVQKEPKVDEVFDVPQAA